MPPARTARIAAALAVAALSGWLAYLIGTNNPPFVSDFDQHVRAAQVLLAGGDPYPRLTLPGRPEWIFLYLYPLTAAWAGLPFAGMDFVTARVVFVALSGAAFAYAATRDGWAPLLVVASNAYLSAVMLAQWTPLVAAVSVLPWLGWALACKPNVALIALAGARWEDRRRWAMAIALAAVFALLTLAVDPQWPVRWRASVAAWGVDHYEPYLLIPWGWLMLAAALRWRDPMMRTLLAIAVIPHTPGTREALLLAVAPGLRWWEAAGIVAGTWLVRNELAGFPLDPFKGFADYSAHLMLLCVYLPMVAARLIVPAHATHQNWDYPRVLRVLARAARVRRYPRAQRDP